jgi:tRNA dimethylallyltransferase
VNSHNQKLIVLCGPTAVGKTELSLQIAERFSCEIVGVDSMQVYRFMDIGTAKPTLAERQRIPHYLIDIVDPDYNYTLGRFVNDANEAIQTIYSHGKTPLLTGGTGLYLKGLLEGLFDENVLASVNDKENNREKISTTRQELRKKLQAQGNEDLYRELKTVDPDSAGRIHTNDTQRLLRALEIYYSTGIPWSQHLANHSKKKSQYKTLKIGLTRPRKELYTRINQRVEFMIEQGLLAEVKKLLSMGFDSELKAMKSLGYRHMINYLNGNWTWEQALEKLARDTRHYAKRQYTWFNNDPEIIWHDVREKDTILREIEFFLTQGAS